MNLCGFDSVNIKGAVNADFLGSFVIVSLPSSTASFAKTILQECAIASLYVSVP